MESNDVGNVIKTDEENIELPENIFFIATMNPHVGKEDVDYAWFRRFTLLELRADSELLQADEDDSEDYKEYIWYAKEFFEHVRMLFEYYYADKENSIEMIKNIPGCGLFLQYNNKSDLKGNIDAFHNRMKYIVAPLLMEQISQGILMEYAQNDIIALKDIFGEDLKINNNVIDGRVKTEFKNLYIRCLNLHDEGLPWNLIFLFILHSHNPELRVKIGNDNISIVEQYKYIQEYPVLEIVPNAKKQGIRNTYGSSVVNINDTEYRFIVGTAHGSMDVLENGKYIRATDAVAIPKCLNNNIDNIIARIKKIIYQ